jgi:hypothetical protein
MSPSKRTELDPGCAANANSPAGMARAQRRLPLFLLVGATHRFPTLRPLAERVNANITVAGMLRSKESFVPTGGSRCRREKLASCFPSRHVRADSARSVIAGLAGFVDPEAVVEVVPVVESGFDVSAVNTSTAPCLSSRSGSPEASVVPDSAADQPMSAPVTPDGGGYARGSAAFSHRADGLPNR